MLAILDLSNAFSILGESLLIFDGLGFSLATYALKFKIWLDMLERTLSKVMCSKNLSLKFFMFDF